MSRYVEVNEGGGCPLVKVYSRREVRKLFSSFRDVSVEVEQLTRPELPVLGRFIPESILRFLRQTVGGNVIVSARRSGKIHSRKHSPFPAPDRRRERHRLGTEVISVECAGRAKRRRRFGWRFGRHAEGSYDPGKSKAVSRFTCHRAPKFEPPRRCALKNGEKY